MSDKLIGLMGPARERHAIADELHAHGFVRESSAALAVALLRPFARRPMVDPAPGGNSAEGLAHALQAACRETFGIACWSDAVERCIVDDLAHGEPTVWTDIRQRTDLAALHRQGGTLVVVQPWIQPYGREHPIQDAWQGSDVHYVQLSATMDNREVATYALLEAVFPDGRGQGVGSGDR